METTRPTQVQSPSQSHLRGSGRTLALFLVPIILLAGIIALFLYTNGAGLNVEPAAPIESLQFERTILRPDRIEFRIQNTSPQEITVAQLIINDAVWPYAISPS